MEDFIQENEFLSTLSWNALHSLGRDDVPRHTENPLTGAFAIKDVNRQASCQVMVRFVKCQQGLINANYTPSTINEMTPFFFLYLWKLYLAFVSQRWYLLFTKLKWFDYYYFPFHTFVAHLHYHHQWSHSSRTNPTMHSSVVCYYVREATMEHYAPCSYRPVSVHGAASVASSGPPALAWTDTSAHGHQLSLWSANLCNQTRTFNDSWN